jgi:hypothetical protein
VILLYFCFFSVESQNYARGFKVIAFYTGKDDLAHISFVRAANQWFPKMAEKYDFAGTIS